MELNMLRIIKNALIGGRNGEMVFIYNSPLVRELFDEYEYTPSKDKEIMNYEDDKFTLFLKDILKDT